MKPFKMIALLFCLLAIGPVIAQSGECPAIVETLLANLDTICQDTQRNQACYGNLSMEASPRDGVADFQFEEVGDIEDVAEMESLKLRSLDESTGVWGVAIMKLQANLPNTLPGENVIFLLFGDVELINAVPDDSTLNPMQAFYLRTGVGAPACGEAPQDGVLVQTPEGRGQVTFNVNGVSMALGSTALLRAPGGTETVATVIEGSGALVDDAGNVTPLIAGSEATFALDANAQPASLVSEPVGYSEETVSALPITVLERPIEVAQPLTDEQIRQIQGMLELGLPPCSVADFLPDCENLPIALRGDLCELDEAGLPDCNRSSIEELNETVLLPYTPTGQAEAGTSPTQEPISELPTGCEPGICLQEPAKACQCSLCGVACPAGTQDNPPAAGLQSDPGGGSGQAPPSGGTGNQQNPTCSVVPLPGCGVPPPGA